MNSKKAKALRRLARQQKQAAPWLSEDLIYKRAKQIAKGK